MWHDSGTDLVLKELSGLSDFSDFNIEGGMVNIYIVSSFDVILLTIGSFYKMQWCTESLEGRTEWVVGPGIQAEKITF